MSEAKQSTPSADIFVLRSDGPEILYKFRALTTVEDWRRFEEICSRRSLWLPALGSFNDPFEGRVSLRIGTGNVGTISRWVNKGLRQLTNDSPARRLGEARRVARKIASTGISMDLPPEGAESLGVLCLVKCANNLLMWSHYASGHAGVAIGFRRKTAAPFNLFSLALEVDYRNKKPVVDPIADSPDAKFRKAILTKARCWEPEQEWRLPAYGPKMDQASVSRCELSGLFRVESRVGEYLASGGGGDRWLRFADDDIVSVVLGARLGAKERRRAVDVIRQHFPDAKLLQSECAPDNYEVVISQSV